MSNLDYPGRPRYFALTRAFGEQARDLYPNASWEDVCRELEVLWKSYVTELEWSEVAEQVRDAWLAANPRRAAGD